VIAQVLAVACAAAPCASTHAQLSMQPYASGFDSPLYVTAAPGDASRIYVVEQTGRIRIVQNGHVVGTFLDLRSKTSAGGERGLLSMAFHPQYAQNHRFYVSYTDTSGNSRVVEYRSANGLGVPSTARQILFVHQPYSNHNGGQIQFDKRGFLYVGFGDGGSEGDPNNTSQNLSVRLGKLLRTNPLRGGWQMVGYGLRNPWRFSFDRATNDLWIGDVGQDHWEEVDYRNHTRLGKLANYGWSRFEGKVTYDSHKPLRRSGALVFPVAVYSHSLGCSVTGGFVYRGSAVPAARGRYFYGDFCSGRVWSFRVSGGRASAPRQERFTVPSLSGFGEDANGELYATSLSNGTVYRLTP
jgi:glucose/arabinose dehydrogenase